VAPHSNRSARRRIAHLRTRVAQPIGPLRNPRSLARRSDPQSLASIHRPSAQRHSYYQPWSKSNDELAHPHCHGAAAVRRRRTIPRFDRSDEPTTQPLTVGETRRTRVIVIQISLCKIAGFCQQRELFLRSLTVVMFSATASEATVGGRSNQVVDHDQSVESLERATSRRGKVLGKMSTRPTGRTMSRNLVWLVPVSKHYLSSRQSVLSFGESWR
jgi:hypothetical protein